jgi:hypothetical protein
VQGDSFDSRGFRSAAIVPEAEFLLAWPLRPSVIGAGDGAAFSLAPLKLGENAQSLKMDIDRDNLESRWQVDRSSAHADSCTVCFRSVLSAVELFARFCR